MPASRGMRGRSWCQGTRPLAVAAPPLRRLGGWRRGSSSRCRPKPMRLRLAQTSAPRVGGARCAAFGHGWGRLSRRLHNMPQAGQRAHPRQAPAGPAMARSRRAHFAAWQARVPRTLVQAYISTVRAARPPCRRLPRTQGRASALPHVTARTAPMALPRAALCRAASRHLTWTARAAERPHFSRCRRCQPVARWLLPRRAHTRWHQPGAPPLQGRPLCLRRKPHLRPLTTAVAAMATVVCRQVQPERAATARTPSLQSSAMPLPGRPARRQRGRQRAGRRASGRSAGAQPPLS
jgi:hypothetical protein